MKLTASGDLLTGGGDTDDDALTPALVAGLQSGAHDVDVASAVKGVVASIRVIPPGLLIRIVSFTDRSSSARSVHIGAGEHVAVQSRGIMG